MIAARGGNLLLALCSDGGLETIESDAFASKVYAQNFDCLISKLAKVFVNDS
jgi:hypothetical protein